MEKAKLMVVEDEALVALDLVGRLRKMGYEVSAAAISGAEAIHLAEETVPDLALMDINLGGGEMDGIEAATRLRERLGLPVVFLTAYSDEATLARAKRSGAYGYLVKPFREGEIRATIEMALSKRAVEKELEAVYAQLDRQLHFLNHLYHLRNRLTNTRVPAQVIADVGQALVDIGAETGVRKVEVEYARQRWGFGWTAAVTRHWYEREIAWAGRCRGLLRLGSDRRLSELEERMLLDETTGLLARVLESRELEAQLLHSARLVSLGEMAAGVAHELNQPLMAISTTAEDVYLRLVDGIALPEAQLKEMMQDVLAMVERMGGIIEHMRVFSRDVSQEQGERLSLNGVVEEALKLMGTQLRNHGIEVELELEKGLPELVGHAHQLEQVMVNLLSNARDALDEKVEGKKRLIVRSRQEEGWVLLEVEDSGVGMDEETQGRVFEPFFTTKPVNRGTGLGLSVSHAIVEDHRGELSCRSQLGQGAVFAVKIPAAVAR